MVKKKMILILILILVVILLILIGLWVYSAIYKETHKKVEASIYNCKKDSDCTWQKSRDVCRSCACPAPVSKESFEEVDCSQFEFGEDERCDLLCSAKKLKCIDSKCVAVSY